jgi:hypothetical protein
MERSFVQRKPDFRVSILRPNYETVGYYSEEEVMTFESRETNKILLNYSYHQDVNSFESSFSMTFTPEVLSDNGDTIMELVKTNDVVKIEEFGQIKFLGVVKKRRYAGSMASGGPDRMIIIGGYGIGGILQKFDLLLDQIILADALKTVDGLNQELAAFIATLSNTPGENASMAQILKQIMQAFYRAQVSVGGFTEGTGIYKLVETYMAFSSESEKLRTKYPMALSVFTYGGNNLISILESLVFKPFYEFFMRWDKDQRKFLMTLRPTPFDPEAWLQLKKTSLSPIHTTMLDVGFSDEDVKTWFFAYMCGGSLSYEEARYAAQAVAIEKDSARWSMYGFRPLEAAFKYVDYEKLKQNESNVTVGKSSVNGDVSKDRQAGVKISDATLMSDYSKKMYQWFKRADEMLTGSITAMTMEDSPTIGERLEYKGVQFYIESVDGSWENGGDMSSKYTLTRGGIYNENFAVGTDESASNWWFRPTQANGMR